MKKWFNLDRITRVFRGFLVLSLLGFFLLTSPGYALSPNSSGSPTHMLNLSPAVGSLADGSSGPITGSSQGVCEGSFCWYYSGAEENYINAKGASVSMTQADPVVSTTDYHSLTEIALKSQNGQQIVEFGWIVAPEMFGDSLPHLFVYHWVNGNSTCYDTCGYISLASPNPVGSPVTVGQTGKYEIKYSGNKWEIIYNGQYIGYFPESIWGGSFKKAFTVEIYGEVSAPNGVAPTTQMGNAILGNEPGAAQVSNYDLINSPVKEKLYPFVFGDPRSYAIGNVTKTSFSYGGPGGY
ncbi:MAG TPA: neprosin family prolyl endopeptidase [Candidatus Saccharimonadales bacterium]|nr:neprosin family prolyl endopeptidase [Candidatus Saccharimonadales bacterium]